MKRTENPQNGATLTVSFVSSRTIFNNTKLKYQNKIIGSLWKILEISQQTRDKDKTLTLTTKPAVIGTRQSVLLDP